MLCLSLNFWDYLIIFIVLTKDFKKNIVKVFCKNLKKNKACHNSKLYHRDLKILNILLDGDFNRSLNYDDPEFLLHRSYNDFKADIFIWGIVLLTLAILKIGFLEATKIDLFLE